MHIFVPGFIFTDIQVTLLKYSLSLRCVFGGGGEGVACSVCNGDDVTYLSGLL